MHTTTLNIHNLGAVTFKVSYKAKYQRITVYPDKAIKVTIPENNTIDEAKQFLISKTPWIHKQLNKIDRQIKSQNQLDLNIDLVKAQQDLFSRLEYFSQKYNLLFKSAKFRCQKTKWGSCLAKNNINLNINIAFLPEGLQDYILLHELVHTKIKNHGRTFWAELDKYTNGKAKELSKKLKAHSLKLIE
jgi:predicted metal-dependent hydrolase